MDRLQDMTTTQAGRFLLKRTRLIAPLVFYAALLTGDLRAAAESAPGVPASSPARPSKTVPAEFPRYAGSASCEECHEEAYEEWLTSHHANAQRDLAPELDREAFTPKRTIKHGTQTSFADIQDGRYVITTTGSDGKRHGYEPTGVLAVYPLRQYLIPAPGGRLQVTELAWDPDKKEWFDVYGDEDRQHWEWGHWSQRGMNWNSMCATCHTTAFRKNYDPDTDAYESRYLEKGVGCEQCHGPMKAHVDWQEENPEEGKKAEETGERLDPTLPDFDRDDYLDICGACHARRADVTGDYPAGDAFIEHYEPVLPDLTDTFYPDGQVREEDFEYVPFMLSYMQNWGVRCMDCHYWHTGKIASTENKLCLRCHENGISTKRPIDEVEHSQHPSDKPGFKCVDCHMPQTPYMQRHWRRDHGMTIPDPLLTKEHGIPNACTRCHQEEGLDWSIKYVEEWYGKLMDRPTRTRARLLARMKKGELEAAGPLIALLQEEENPSWRAVYVRFLDMVIRSSSDEKVVMPVVDQLVACLSDPSPLVQAVAVDALEPLARFVADPLAVKLDSPHRLVRVKAAWALRQWLDRGSRAGGDLITSLEYRQDQPLGAFQWATLHADTGEPTKALPWYEKAIRWDVRLAPARHNYATVLNGLGRSGDAIEVLEAGATIDPDSALYRYWLGLLYHEVGDEAGARNALRAAVDRDATQARFWYNLALAENKLGRVDAALDALDQAERLEPDNPHYPYTRATIHRGHQQHDQARDALERALKIDPGYRPALDLRSGF